MSKSTYAFQFYLDLLAGNIVPMQNATAIANISSNEPKHLTTSALQQEPVDIHIMPKCGAAAGSACTAAGDYINDDGETLDLTKRNTYAFSYTHTPAQTGSPATLTLTITASGQKAAINKNDMLGSVQIYDYTHLNLGQGTYKVSVTDASGTKDMGNAVFQLWDDRLAWTVPADQTVQLFDATTVTFTLQQ